MNKMLSAITTGITVMTLLLFGMVPAGSQSDPDREITAVNIEYEGSKVWVPATLVVKKGERVRMKLINKVKSDPNVHGFEIGRAHV